MPLDPQRLARVRAHLLTAAALVTAGCGGSSPPDHTINEPIHVNTLPDAPPPPTSTSAAPSTPGNNANEPIHVNTPPPTSKTPPPQPPASPPPDPIHVNTPRPNNG